MRRPSRVVAEQAVIAVIIPDVDFLMIFAKIAANGGTATVQFDERCGQIAEACPLRRSQIIGAPACLGMRGGEQQGIDAIIDEREITLLRATPNLNGMTFNKSANPDPDERLPRIFHAHSRAVRVRQS